MGRLTPLFFVETPKLDLSNPFRSAVPLCCVHCVHCGERRLGIRLRFRFLNSNVVVKKG